MMLTIEDEREALMVSNFNRSYNLPSSTTDPKSGPRFPYLACGEYHLPTTDVAGKGICAIRTYGMKGWGGYLVWS